MGKKTLKQKKVDKFSGFFKGARRAAVSACQERPVEFSFFAPKAICIGVSGSFNDWTPGGFSLKIDETGMWRGIIALKPGVYQYRFFVNEKWADDPRAQKTVVNPFGTKNAVLEVK